MAFSIGRALVLGLLAAVPLTAESASITDLVTQTGSRYKGMSAFRAEGTIVLSSAQGTQEGTFKVAGRGEKRTREELSGISSYLSVGTESDRWLYVPERKQYTHTKVDATTPEQTFTIDVRKFARLSDRGAEATELAEETIVVASGATKRQRSCRKVKLPIDVLGPLVQRARVESYTVWIEPSTGEIVREAIEMAPPPTAAQASRLSMTVTYSLMELNGHLDESLFTFTPPEGATPFTGQSQQEPPSPFEGKPAKDFTLTTLTGKRVSLADLRGKIVLLDFWATWCGPCKMEMPHIQKLHEDLEQKGVAILAISSEQEPLVRRFMEKAGYTIPTTVDAGATVTRAYGVSAYPTVFVIDKEGIIRAHYVGLRPVEVLKGALVKAGLEE
jgi:peroxiredoxin/outer membrane lipoprotein-sorting protein